MIFVEGDDGKVGSNRQPVAAVSADRKQEEHLPSYDDAAQLRDAESNVGTISSASESIIPSHPPLTSKPTNFLSLTPKDRSITGCYAINPFLSIPASLLAPLLEGESEADRKNLDLQSKQGYIDVDISLMTPDESDSNLNPKSRATLYLSSNHGSVSTRVYAVGRPIPFFLNVNCPNGQVTVYLPRSFCGLLLLTTKHGTVSLSNELSANSTTLSQVDMTMRYFLGDFSAMTEDEWSGDELKVDANNGRIRVRYVDELNVRKPGLFSRMFGL
ncbi:hypothetical protein SERLA73DRAFT_174687 [Serpula lacrymans var. lacrymans S7.3]|uniref:DUF7330 domain-containing protein n=2 Tax=Serpula lacrymans var. lacrymans TaxID=341189 RepID=F8PJN1_SERL3|nr:uncharacterized protein SERLADRAFT_456329 [Serpula lacrymans var. lacrymans S7.9]EGO03232.1 hypothetical protein SERLA73DRAFT_174687 [Serpula lacrymans var. lacrymans S7.3]EGO29015.1 hypothetical protein SERLADRAFT_456329 [Serpula lacrymans var. lacrymans S7.9]